MAKSCFKTTPAVVTYKLNFKQLLPIIKQILAYHSIFVPSWTCSLHWYTSLLHLQALKYLWNHQENKSLLLTAIKFQILGKNLSKLAQNYKLACMNHHLPKHSPKKSLRRFYFLFRLSKKLDCFFFVRHTVFDGLLSRPFVQKSHLYTTQRKTSLTTSTLIFVFQVDVTYVPNTERLGRKNTTLPAFI